MQALLSSFWHPMVLSTILCTARVATWLWCIRADPTVDGKWYCSHCKCRKSILVDSFFSRAKLSMTTVVDLMYWWSIDVQQSIVLEEVGLSNHTIVDWYNFFEKYAADTSLTILYSLVGLAQWLKSTSQNFSSESTTVVFQGLVAGCLGWYSKIVDSVVWFRCRTEEQPLYCPSFVRMCFQVHA